MIGIMRHHDGVVSFADPTTVAAADALLMP